jgi:hypothetical protein
MVSVHRKRKEDSRINPTRTIRTLQVTFSQYYVLQFRKKLEKEKQQVINMKDQKKQEKRERKKSKGENLLDSEISMPTNFVVNLHVDRKLNWFSKDPKESFTVIDTLGEG